MLFSYGTLQDADVLQAVLGRPFDVSAFAAATAPGFRAMTIPARVYPALVPCRDAAAGGRLLTGFSPADLLRLDRFEGDEYRRTAITIRLNDGTLDTADAFLPIHPIDATGPDWSLATWTERHKHAFLAREFAGY